MLKNLIISLLILISFSTFSQTSWESVGVIYSGNGVSVELEYKLKADSCEPNSNKKSKYQYKLDGTLAGYDLYLNWKMDYYACNGLIMCQTNSVNIGQNDLGYIVSPEYIFNGYKVLKNFYDVRISSSPDNTPVFSKGGMKSDPPNNILHVSQVFPGETAILKVNGGKLGLGSTWVWYKDKCFGSPIGKGVSISTIPLNSTTYYVRAEGPKDTTTCISAFIKVSEKSIVGDSIEGASFICRNERDIKLTLIGGKLGKNAEWKWYKDDCSGKSIGSGRTILVSPIGNSTYFVRAEGPNDISTCLPKQITVVDNSSAPKSIVGNTTTCIGGYANLSVSGGKLAPASNWVWYKDFISSSNVVGLGENINLMPTVSALYIVRAEGVCNNTESVSINITVNEQSQIPSNIEVNNSTYTTNLIKNKKSIFTVLGGKLSNNAKWVWYKSDNSNSSELTKIGSGNSIKIKVKNNIKISVRAEGPICDNDNQFTSKEFTVSKKIGPNKYTYLNFGLCTSSFTTNSNVSPTASPFNAVVTFAKNGSSLISWYVKGKFSLSSSTQSDYITTDEGNLNINNNTPSSTYPIFNSNVIEERYGATVGLLFGPKKMRMFIGGGWGKRDLKWGVSEVNASGSVINPAKWASNTDRYYEGYEVEAGIIMKISIFNIQAGLSTVTPTLSFNDSSSPKELKYFDAHLGIGFNF